MSASRAARADWKGAASNCTATSSTHSSQMGVPGIAISPTSAARATSHDTITPRRGNRSANHESNGPDATSGRNVSAYVAADNPADPVRSNTSTASATRASWSPRTDPNCASHSQRIYETRNTSPYVAGSSSGDCEEPTGRVTDRTYPPHLVLAARRGQGGGRGLGRIFCPDRVEDPPRPRCGRGARGYVGVLVNRSGLMRTAVRRSAIISRSYSSRSGWTPPAAW